MSLDITHLFFSHTIQVPEPPTAIVKNTRQSRLTILVCRPLAAGPVAWVELGRSTFSRFTGRVISFWKPSQDKVLVGTFDVRALDDRLERMVITSKMLLYAREAREDALRKRDDDMSKSIKPFAVIAIIVISILTILVVTFLATRKLRTPYLPAQSKQDKRTSLFSWKKFRRRSQRGEYSTSLQDTEYHGSDGNRESAQMSGAAGDLERNTTTTAAGVDRNTSVRSVMTLPAYAPAARENERVLGREGERGGMDNVIELPETQDDEEVRREEEMESLYQIRLARRVEATDREARRQARRDARARGDVHALADIRRRAEEATDLSVSQMLIAEHQTNTRTRERRVSSVAYGDLGVARHDGTRLRANSTESDSRPLLDSAASISGQSHRSRAYSSNTLDPDTHQRGHSITSFDSRASSDYDRDFPEAGRTSSQSRTSQNNTSDEFEFVSLNPERSHSASRGPTTDIPRENAPAYEDPPNYESPINTRAPQLPSLDRLPSIQVTPDIPSGDLGTR